jgi:hypothetical protein
LVFLTLEVTTVSVTTKAIQSILINDEIASTTAARLEQGKHEIFGCDLIGKNHTNKHNSGNNTFGMFITIEPSQRYNSVILALHYAMVERGRLLRC